MMSYLDIFQEKFYQEIIGWIKLDDIFVFYKDNGYFYIIWFEKEKEYLIYSCKKGSFDVLEEIMFNVNELVEGFDYFNIGGWEVSFDNCLLAYGEDILSC